VPPCSLAAPADARIRQWVRIREIEIESSQAFRASIRAKYPDAFEFSGQVAVELEQAVETPRGLVGELALAIDMLMGQGYKAHLSVYFLAEVAHVEDAATITRRVLELAIQAVYIGGDDQEAVRPERAGRYIAHMWERLDSSVKAKFSDQAAAPWQSVYDQYSHLLSPKRKRWGPNFKQMFDEIGHPDTYRKDYSLLSEIAHGSPDDLIIHYSAPTVHLRPDVHVPTVLNYASRYYLIIAEQWNRIFHGIDDKVLTRLYDSAQQRV
jgi:hypothetical protein